MKVFFFEGQKTFNVPLLDEELSAIAGYQSCTVQRQGVAVFVDNDVLSREPFRNVLIAHDASQLSSKQAQQLALQGQIQTLKNDVGDIDNLTTLEATAAIKLLYKVLRLNELV